MQQTPDRYAVIGNPIAHSKSPVIHGLFARQTRQSLTYDAILAAQDGFEQAVHAFRDGGGKGLNVTVPFKQQAFAMATERSARADLAGAVNTLDFSKGHIFGDNTDGIGLVRDLQNHGLRLQGLSILLLGAGGAVRGVLGPLLEQQPLQILVANRTAGKAVELAEHFASLGNIQGCGLDAIPHHGFELIINGTAASLQGELPPLPDSCLKTAGCAYDMMYSATATPFLQWADQHGAGQCIDGLGMLVEQAAESFYLWRGVRPDTAPVITALRAQMREGVS